MTDQNDNISSMPKEQLEAAKQAVGRVTVTLNPDWEPPRPKKREIMACGPGGAKGSDLEPIGDGECILPSRNNQTLKHIPPQETKEIRAQEDLPKIKSEAQGVKR